MDWQNRIKVFGRGLSMNIDLLLGRCGIILKAHFQDEFFTWEYHVMTFRISQFLLVMRYFFWTPFKAILLCFMEKDRVTWAEASKVGQFALLHLIFWLRAMKNVHTMSDFHAQTIGNTLHCEEMNCILQISVHPSFHSQPTYYIIESM